jgi:hypothetical protein
MWGTKRRVGEARKKQSVGSGVVGMVGQRVGGLNKQRGFGSQRSDGILLLILRVVAW